MVHKAVSGERKDIGAVLVLERRQGEQTRFSAGAKFTPIHGQSANTVKVGNERVVVLEAQPIQAAPSLEYHAKSPNTPRLSEVPDCLSRASAGWEYAQRAPQLWCIPCDLPPNAADRRHQSPIRAWSRTIERFSVVHNWAADNEDSLGGR